MATALADAVKRVVAEFDFSKEDVIKTTKEFLVQLDEGLKKDGANINQIPTYVTAVPNGTEKGLFMAVDLGGTNFRVCSILLHGNSTFTLTQSKVKVPQELQAAETAQELFAFLAKQIEAFLKEHHGDHYASYAERKDGRAEVFNMGFTFSFPVQQVGINKGYLIRWTKGFNVADAVGKDVCALLQQEIDALKLPVRVAALVNDTVGTLMARSYTSPGENGTLLGAIFGTGTNGAYVEKLDRLQKLTQQEGAGAYDTSTANMIVNTEWGSFDNSMKVLPNTPYDKALDADTPNPGIQMFEKRISGMYLGEITRRALVSLVEDPNVPLFSDDDSATNELHTTTVINRDAALLRAWGLDSAFLSTAAVDESPELRAIRHTITKELGVDGASVEDAQAVKAIAGAVGRRAARLSAVAVGAVVIQSDLLETQGKQGGDDSIDVGVDGSLVEFYPNFENYVREALREIPQIGPAGEKRIRIGIAKDGSGVGAALIALVAGRALKAQESGGGS